MPARTTMLTLLLLWVGAYVTLMVIFTFFGAQLDTLPLPVRVLLVSAVLVVVMTEVAIPVVARVVSRGRK